MRAEHRDGVLLLLTVVLAWGLTWPVNKLVLLTVPPLWAVALRVAIATVALFALGLARGRLALPPRADLPVVFSITLLHMVGFTVLTSFGLQAIPAGRSVVLAYTTPLWVTPGARLFLGEPLTGRRVLGTLVGLAGLALLFNPLAFDWSSPRAVLGNGLILAGALLWAGSILHTRGHRWQTTPFALIPWQTLLSTALLVALSLTFEGVPALTWTPELLALLLYGGLAGTAVPYWALTMATRRLPATTISLGLLATPVVSIAIATLWLREALSLSLLASVALILGGIAIGAAGPPTSLRAPAVSPGRVDCRSADR
jgi:drug/metabolite transporter (DMT)-like permease